LIRLFHVEHSTAAGPMKLTAALPFPAAWVVSTDLFHVEHSNTAGA
jgi:hypothetical protein